MRSIQFLQTLLSLTSGLIVIQTAGAKAADLIVSGTTQISTPSTYDSVVVLAGGTLIADAQIAVSGNMRVASGGVVTHGVRDTSGLVLNVSGTLDVESGGAIDVSGKGLLGGGGSGSAFGFYGETFDTTDAIVAGAFGASGGNGRSTGGSYGGCGELWGASIPSLPYGVAENPRHLGSGGGAWGTRGGNGGGRIRITATNVVADGVIAANGWYAYQGSGGSGGAIRMDIGSLSGGANGSIQAIGGTDGLATGGGGGRIAIYCTTLNLPTTQISAHGGTGGAAGRHGSAGTIYLKDAAYANGDLIIDNGNIVSTQVTPLRMSSTTLPHLTIRNQGVLAPNIDLSFADASDFELSSGGTLIVQNNRTFSIPRFDETNFQSGTLSLSIGSRLVVSSDSMVVANSLTVVKDGTFGSNSDEIGTLTVQSGGVVTHGVRDTSGLVLNVSGTLDVESGGAIDVSGKGLRGGGGGGSAFGSRGETFDPVTDLIVAGSYGDPDAGGMGTGGGSGGSYGGIGGNGTRGSTATGTYGVFEHPRHLGSGGGCGMYGAAGGSGGGRMTITAGTCIVNGTVAANGTNSGNSAGSGGSIFVSVGDLSGTGVIQAVGGNGIGYPVCGSGGGGRIAIFYRTLTLSNGHLLSYGGFGGSYGSAGSLYLKDSAQAYGDLMVDNANYGAGQWTYLRTGLSTLRSLSVNNRGALSLVSSNITSISIQQPLLLANSSMLEVGSGVTLAVSNASGFDLNVQSGSTVILDTGSVLNANAIRCNAATLTTNINLSFPVESDLELSGGSTLNILNNTIFTVGTFTPTNFQSCTVNLPVGSRLDILAGSAVVDSGVTLVKDGRLGPSDQLTNLTVQSGGVVTHGVRDTSGLVLNVSGTLDVESGGAIDVSGKGLRGGGGGGSAFGSRGETFDPVTDSIVAGSYGDPDAGGMGTGGGSGGSYGGIGGNGTRGATATGTYGVFEHPRHLGSGGGCGMYGAAGGNGGGRIRILAGTCVVNGAVAANGSNSGNSAGSGGSIFVSVGDLSGTGVIQAVGGNGIGYPVCGSGGGGRIAVFYQTTNLASDHVFAAGGSTGAVGRIGSVLYLDSTQTTRGRSVTDKVIILSPAGTIPFCVTLRDALGNPIVNSTDAWLDFSECPNINPSNLQLYWPQVPAFAYGASDGQGQLRFYVAAGGCTTDSVRVMSTNGLIAKVPMRSLDRTGGLVVSWNDYDGSTCNDYDGNDTVDQRDFDFFSMYVGQTGLGQASDYVNLGLSTTPGPGSIYAGDVIQLNVPMSNKANEAIMIDTIIYSYTGFGIAQKWTEFARTTNFLLGPRESVALGQGFAVPKAGHGCLQVKIIPEFFLNGKNTYSKDVRSVKTVMSQTLQVPITDSFKNNMSLIASDNFPVTVSGFLFPDYDVISKKMQATGDGYTTEQISGRTVMRPKDSKYDLVLPISPPPGPRFEVAVAYVDLLRKTFREFANLLPPPYISLMKQNIYEDSVVITPNRRVIEQLVDLLGKDATMMFAIIPAPSGLPMLNFLTNPQSPRSLLTLNCTDQCKNCQITNISYTAHGDQAGPGDYACGVTDQDHFIPDDYCGIGQGYAPITITGSCEGCPITEVVKASPPWAQPKQGSTWTVHNGTTGNLGDCVYIKFDPKDMLAGQDLWIYYYQILFWCGRCHNGEMSIIYTFHFHENLDFTCSSEMWRDVVDQAHTIPCDPPTPKAISINIDAPEKPKGPGLATFNQIGPARSTAVAFLTPSSGTKTDTFLIPVGPASGEFLSLRVIPQMPVQWSWTISDSTVVITPDTVAVMIQHPAIVECADTGRVTVLAFDSAGADAGYAEIRVQPLGKVGDCNGDGIVDISDLTMLVDYLFLTMVPPTIMDAADINQDGAVDISDVTRFVDFLFTSFTPLSCSHSMLKAKAAAAAALFSANVIVDSAFTTISIDAPQSLRGLEMTLIGPDKTVPVKLVGDSLDMYYGRVDSMLRIGIFDRNGSNVIHSGTSNVVQIPGRYHLSWIKASDLNFRSVLGKVTYTAGPTLPKEFALYLNYPNPFNPVTTIAFDLPKTANVQLIIYNTLGQEVRTLVNQSRPAGHYRVQWDGRSNAGYPVASGVYFYRLQAGDFTESRKMVLLK